MQSLYAYTVGPKKGDTFANYWSILKIPRMRRDGIFIDRFITLQIPGQYASERILKVVNV